MMKTIVASWHSSVWRQFGHLLSLLPYIYNSGSHNVAAFVQYDAVSGNSNDPQFQVM